jgi:hypothetical protein
MSTQFTPSPTLPGYRERGKSAPLKLTRTPHGNTGNSTYDACSAS